MSPTLLTYLHALLAKWDDLAAASAGRVPTPDNPIQGSFYMGAMFCAETVRDELAAFPARMQSK